MLVVMHSRATPEEIRVICERIEALGFREHSVEGSERYAIGGEEFAIIAGTVARS